MPNVGFSAVFPENIETFRQCRVCVRPSVRDIIQKNIKNGFWRAEATLKVIKSLTHGYPRFFKYQVTCMQFHELACGPKSLHSVS